MKLQEDWRTVPEFPNYEVSNYGRVRSYFEHNGRGLKYLKPQFSKKRGYYYIGMRRGDGKRVNRIVHRIVAELFVSNPNGLPVVNHVDCDRRNNNYLNLEWCTTQENNRHAWRMGRNIPTRGEMSGASKLTEAEVIEMLGLLASGDYMNKDLAKKFDVAPSTVAHIKRGSRWAHLNTKKGLTGS